MAIRADTVFDHFQTPKHVRATAGGRPPDQAELEAAEQYGFVHIVRQVGAPGPQQQPQDRGKQGEQRDLVQGHGSIPWGRRGAP